jgi:TRAP-type C4-dicarboxylate transport system permease small subunit
MLYVGSYRQMMSNWSDISQLTGLPSALFYLAGVVSGLLMGVIAFMRIFKPDWQLDSLDEEKE